MDKKDKRNSFLDKVVRNTVRIGKDKSSKSKEKDIKAATWSSRLPSSGDSETTNGTQYGFGPSPQDNIGTLSDLEVLERFEKLLDDMNLTEEKKAPLRAWDIPAKKKMLAMQVTAVKAKQRDLDTPQNFVAELRNADLKGEKRLRVLESLRVSLTSNPVSWVVEFGLDGLNGILRNLTYCCDSKTERKSTYECVRCLKAFMNNKFGLMQIIQHDEALTILSRTVDPSDPTTMLEAVRLLAAICLVPPDGHEKALEGITVCGEIRGRDRFIPVIMGLGMRDNQPMQVACIQLVNAIVSTPDDLDFRLHLRNEFMRTGLIDLIGSLNSQQDEELQTHLQIFKDHQDEDFEEFSHRYDNIRVEFEDPQQCFTLIQNSVKDTIAEPYFLSILQHLLCIRDDMFSRPQYYKLIEECVTQIVLHRSGTDPDFRHTKRFEIDVEPLLSNLTEKSKYEDFEGSIIEVNNKLETALTAKQESEARAMTLEEKLKQYEQEVADMKEKIRQGIGDTIIAGKGPGGTGAPPPPPAPPPPGGVPPPPPPPPPPGGAPPPPPPPPGMGPPPPPPPPGAPGAPPPPGIVSPPSSKLPYGMSPKRKYELGVQTKRINWNKVQANKMDKEAFWVNVHEDKFEDPNLFAGLLENFAVATKGKKKETDHEEVEVKKKAKELKVLDPKSAQNLSILLGSIKVPFKEIKRRILEVDEDNLNTAILEQLLRYMPEPEQMKQIASLKDHYNELAEPEQFAVEMSSIKRIHPRLNSMLFKMTFPEMVQDIKPDLVAAKEALEEIKTSGKFAKILELILLIGNILNAGSRNAQSVGFDISFLPKLQNTKASDGKTTLVHYLAKIVEERYPDLISFTEELSYVERACRVSDELLQKNLKSMEKSLKQLEIDIKNLKKTQNEEDKFSSVMNEFISSANSQYEVMKGMYKMVDNLYKEMGKYYTFDVKKYAMEEFFNDIKVFKETFVQALKDNAKIRETNEKIRRAKEAKERQQKEREAKLARKKALVDMTIDDDQEGVMDNLLEALKTGSCFNREKRDAKRKTPRAAGDRFANMTRSRVWHKPMYSSDSGSDNVFGAEPKPMTQSYC
ncbi:protein diaphanous homolog 2-like isoform X2 [Saccostrea echinata]|uniref:protein diaphanous homolog 2-like isoform X2 n=1 Tax=Saccostrea echinata TaxID=191078 RepID=UPI002A83C23F|nr:protein diaphanous homolog 2-like isoform X2 [Saccostrea echinata]